MKKTILMLLSVLILMIVTNATALTINEGSIEVGGRDTLVASAVLGNSGDPAEIAWIQSILGTGYTFTKYDTVEADWSLTNENRTYAMKFQTNTPDYYMIKTGTGANDPNNGHFLFENKESLEWAVLNLDADFGGVGYTIKNIGKFSHVVELGGNTPVPEPGTILLLGAGLFGLAIFGKRRMNKES